MQIAELFMQGRREALPRARKKGLVPVGASLHSVPHRKAVDAGEQAIAADANGLPRQVNVSAAFPCRHLSSSSPPAIPCIPRAGSSTLRQEPWNHRGEGIEDGADQPVAPDLAVDDSPYREVAGRGFRQQPPKIRVAPADEQRHEANAQAGPHQFDDGHLVIASA